MKKWHVFLWLALALSACTSTAAPIQTQLSAVEAAQGSGAAGFAKVTEPRNFVFPRDHGPHQEYATEWWYYTGNLDSTDGRHFGYQLTFFRFGLAPTEPQRASAWATTNVYMAHFALTDVANKQFYAFERFSRSAAGLAGATGNGQFRVWIDDWQAQSSGREGVPMRLHAQHDGVGIDLTLDGGKPVVLQGPGGVSQKSATRGNASYYYSLTRMPTAGTITVNGQQSPVSGRSWLDREFGTSSLEAGAQGWDWFAIQLDDGRDLMYYRIRGTNGAGDYQFGTLVEADGTTSALNASDVQLTANGTWRSPGSNTEYPARWRIQVASAQIDVQITPYLQNQELPLAVTYWEGATSVAGTSAGKPTSGTAYVELTGYAEQGSVRVR